jgi:hypothetical protein
LKVVRCALVVMSRAILHTLDEKNRERDRPRVM